MDLGLGKINNRISSQINYRPKVNPLANYPLEYIVGRTQHNSNVHMYDDPRGIIFPEKRVQYDVSRGLIPTRAIDRYANELDRVTNFGADYSPYNVCGTAFPGFTPAPPGAPSMPRMSTETRSPGVMQTLPSIQELQQGIEKDLSLMRLKQERAPIQIYHH